MKNKEKANWFWVYKAKHLLKNNENAIDFRWLDAQKKIGKICSC